MGIYDEEEPSRLCRVCAAIGCSVLVGKTIIGCVVLAAFGLTVKFAKGYFDQSSRSRQNQNSILVDLPPPPSLPPPPPPPLHAPPPPMETEQKMIAQEPVSANESKPAEAPASELPTVGTSIQGNGPPDAFGVGQGKSYFGGGKAPPNTSGGGSQWGWYASQVRTTLSLALQKNTHTRTAEFRVVVRIWSDQTGRITRARLERSTGDATLDKAITDEVLVGHVLQEPPPDGMPMPIKLQLSARHSTVALSRAYP